MLALFLPCAGRINLGIFPPKGQCWHSKILRKRIPFLRAKYKRSIFCFAFTKPHGTRLIIPHNEASGQLIFKNATVFEYWHFYH